MVEIRQNFCGKCGAPVLDGSEQFCGNCGAPLRLDALAEQANLGGQTSVPVGPDPSSAAEKPGDDGTQESTSKTRSDHVEPQVGDAESRTLRGWLIQHEIARVIGFRRTSNIDSGVLGLKGRMSRSRYFVISALSWLVSTMAGLAVDEWLVLVLPVQWIGVFILTMATAARLRDMGKYPWIAVLMSLFVIVSITPLNFLQGFGNLALLGFVMWIWCLSQPSTDLVSQPADSPTTFTSPPTTSSNSHRLLGCAVGCGVGGLLALAVGLIGAIYLAI